MNRRKERLEKAIEEQVSVILLREIRDARIGFCTLSKVSCTNDLRYATIYVSFIGTEKQEVTGMEGLRSATKRIQSLLASRINMKFAPLISFELDHSIEDGVNLIHKIDKIVSESKEEDGSSL
jgi:ribosome-binding factor A